MPDGSGDALIPSLPKHLQRVPGFTSRTDDAWRGEYFAWREALLDFREDVHLTAERDPGFRDNERFLCADDPKYYLAVWGWVYEPRARKGLSKHNPFLPFAFQCHTIDWLRDIADMEEQYDGYVTKSRGIGLSWAIVAFAVWGWNFDDITTLLLSRTQSEVDKPNNINTLFGKALYLIEHTPDWLLPPGFNRDRDRTQMNIANPYTKAQIFGDSTTGDAARGDRATIAFVDEAAFIRDLKHLKTTIQGTSDHTIYVSTESIQNGFEWVETWENAVRIDRDAVCIYDWPINPFQDEAWRQREYQRRLKNNDLQGYYLEIERNWTKGRTNLVYPEARTVSFDGPGYNPTLPLLIAMDPGVVDDTAIIFGQPLDGDPRFGKIVWFDSYENNGKPAEFYANLLTGILPQPGDAGYAYDFADPSTKRIMALMESVSWSHDRVKIVMDPTGKQKDSGNSSFQTRIIQESKKLRQRWLTERGKKGVPAGDLPKLRPLTPICEDLFPINNHLIRHQAARDLLSRSIFHDSPGGRRIADALARYRKQEPTPRATREPIPVHDADCSHLATAFEYAGGFASAGYFGTKRKEKTPLPEWQMPDLAGAAA